MVDLITVFGKGLQLRTEEVPFAPSGLAAGSLVSFLPDAAEASTRLVAGTDDDILVLAFCSRSAKARSHGRATGSGCALATGSFPSTWSGGAVPSCAPAEVLSGRLKIQSAPLPLMRQT